MSSPMTFEQFFAIIRKRMVWIALLTACSVGSVYFFTFFVSKPVYANTVTLLINDGNTETNPLTFDVILMYEKLMGTYRDIIYSRGILEPVSERYGLNYNTLLNKVKVIISTDSQIIKIEVRDLNFETSTKIANDISTHFLNKLELIMRLHNVEVLDPATNYDDPVPVSPNKKLNLIVGFVLSFVISISFFVVLHIYDTRIRDEDDLSLIVPYPVLGTIISYPKKKSKRTPY